MEKVAHEGDSTAVRILYRKNHVVFTIKESGVGTNWGTTYISASSGQVTVTTQGDQKDYPTYQLRLNDVTDRLLVVKNQKTGWEASPKWLLTKQE